MLPSDTMTISSFVEESKNRVGGYHVEFSGASRRHVNSFGEGLSRQLKPCRTEARYHNEDSSIEYITNNCLRKGWKAQRRWHEEDQVIP